MNKANVEWVKGLTRLPNVVGGSISDAVAGHVANGIMCGNFLAINCTDIPDGSTNWGFNVMFFTGEHTVVFAKRSYSSAMWYAELDSDGWESGGWIGPLATATPPEEHDLPLAAGWTAGRKTKFSVSQDSLVLVTFGVWGPANTSDRTVIAQLPPGFRPGELISTGCIVVDDKVIRYTAGLDIDPNGSVIVYANHIGWTSAVGQVAFYAGI